MADDESKVDARASEVKALLADRKNEDAVKASLRDPPILSKNDATKDKNAQTVLQAMLACNKGEMQRVIDSLTPDLEDTLMKYVARFTGSPAQSATVLDWHQKLTAKAGQGSIMRAFTDRKQV